MERGQLFVPADAAPERRGSWPSHRPQQTLSWGPGIYLGTFLSIFYFIFFNSLIFFPNKNKNVFKSRKCFSEKGLPFFKSKGGKNTFRPEKVYFIF